RLRFRCRRFFGRRAREEDESRCKGRTTSTEVHVRKPPGGWIIPKHGSVLQKRKWKLHDSCSSGPEIRSRKVNGLLRGQGRSLSQLRISGSELQESCNFHFRKNTRQLLVDYLQEEFYSLVACQQGAS